MQNFSRFFAVGCSYTNFYWPTWADIIAHDLQIEYQNWGLSGAGNVAIQHRLINADVINRFTDTDLIIVNWTSWNREDRYHHDWLCGGNIYNNPFYDRAFIKKHHHFNNDLIKNSTAIYTSNKIFNINYQATICDPNIDDYIDASKNEKNYSKLLYTSNTIEIFPNEVNMSFDNSITEIDSHPDILTHLYHVKNNIYPKLGFELKKTTITKFQKLHIQLTTQFKKFKNLNEIQKYCDSEIKQNPKLDINGMP